MTNVSGMMFLKLTTGRFQEFVSSSSQVLESTKEQPEYKTSTFYFLFEKRSKKTSEPKDSEIPRKKVGSFLSFVCISVQSRNYGKWVKCPS